jgi:hypothetical protein
MPRVRKDKNIPNQVEHCGRVLRSYRFGTYPPDNRRGGGGNSGQNPGGGGGGGDNDSGGGPNPFPDDDAQPSDVSMPSSLGGSRAPSPPPPPSDNGNSNSNSRYPSYQRRRQQANEMIRRRRSQRGRIQREERPQYKEDFREVAEDAYTWGAIQQYKRGERTRQKRNEAQKASQRARQNQKKKKQLERVYKNLKT